MNVVNLASRNRKGATMDTTSLTPDGVAAILAQHSHSPVLRIQIKAEQDANRVREGLPAWLDEKAIQSLVDDQNTYVMIDSNDLYDVISSFEEIRDANANGPLQWQMAAVVMSDTDVRYCSQVTSQNW